MLAGFISGRHNDVTLGIALELELLSDLVPWNELLGGFVGEVLLAGVLAGGIDIEADHAPHEVHANLLLPSVLWTGQSDLDCGELFTRWQLKLDVELGIVDPCEPVHFLLELLVIEMAPACGLFSPLASDHGILGVFELLHFDRLAAEDCECEVREDLLLAHGRNDDERALRWLVEGVPSRHVVAKVVGLLIPLPRQELKLALQVLQARRLELGYLVGLIPAAADLLQGLRILRCLSDRGRHGAALVFAGLDDLSGRRVGGSEGLGHRDADRDALDSTASLLFQDDLQVSGLCDVKEILRVATPELVLLT